MDTENSNSTPQTERDRINEQLDELRQSQQERKRQKKTRPRWKRRLLGFLGVISGLFLLGTSCSKPTVTCYRHAGPEDEEEAPVEKSLEKSEEKCVETSEKKSVNDIDDDINYGLEKMAESTCYMPAPDISNDEDDEPTDNAQNNDKSEIKIEDFLD